METPGCQLNQMEGGVLGLYREAQAELMRYRTEDHEAHRTFYSLGAAHSAALMREEEKGYARGLADGHRSLPGGNMIEDTLFAEIAHGDEQHRDWLKNKLRDFFRALSPKPDTIREGERS